METIKYNNFVWALGRNGIMTQTGIKVDTYPDYIVLTPVNTKGIGRGNLRVPTEDVDKLIQALLKGQSSLKFPETWVCAYCGHQINESDVENYCPNCGEETY